MSDKKEIKIGPPQNKEYRDLMDEINRSFEKLNKLSSSLPVPKDLIADSFIDLNEKLGQEYKKMREYETEFTDLLQRATDFRGNPTLDFKPNVDIRISINHYLSLFNSRIDSLEDAYYKHIEKVQRIEDFINKHNSNLKTEKSLKFGRISIWLGWGGIILGLISIGIGVYFQFFY